MLPVMLDDATAASVAEHLSSTDGDCLPSSTSYISVGTGIGAGAVLQDRVWVGATGKAMNLGHVPVPAASNKPCACGGRGCLQTAVSGYQLEKRAKELGLPSKKILELAAAGDDLDASRFLISMTVPLAQGIQIVERLINPDRIILGGGLIEEDILFELVANAARELGCRTPIIKSRWGTWAGALGVALEVFRRAGLSMARLTDTPELVSYRFALIQGPNLNLLGKREPEHYGSSTLKEIETRMTMLADGLGCHLYCVQSNSESDLVEWLQQRLDRLDGVIINPAALTAHGYALRDALTAKRTPFIEVHLSNVYKRENWHQESCFTAIALGCISGLGELGYEAALRSLAHHLSQQAN
jgi:3-dehydroquinate dehydratase-2